METKKHWLQTLEENLSYFQSLLSTQADPSRFNALVVPIEQRIGIITKYIQKDGENVSGEDLAFAFSLLREYVTLWELYFKNRPLPPIKGK